MGRASVIKLQFRDCMQDVGAGKRQSRWGTGRNVGVTGWERITRPSCRDEAVMDRMRG